MSPGARGSTVPGDLLAATLLPLTAAVQTWDLGTSPESGPERLVYSSYRPAGW